MLVPFPLFKRGQMCRSTDDRSPLVARQIKLHSFQKQNCMYFQWHRPFILPIKTSLANSNCTVSKNMYFQWPRLFMLPIQKKSHLFPLSVYPHPSFYLPGPAPDAPKQWRKQWQQEPWRNQMWHYISRSYLTSLWQFRQVVHLFCRLSLMKEDCIPTSVASLQTPTFHSIRFRKGKEHKKRKTAPYSHQHLN